MRKGNWLTIPWVGEFGQGAQEVSGMFPSRYPPGTSTILALLSTFFGSGLGSVMAASVAISCALVVAGVVAGVLVGGWPAGSIAAVLLGTSPFVLHSSTIIMADALGALLTLLVFIAVERAFASETASWKQKAWIVTAGTFVGVAVLTRFSLLVLFLAAAVALRRIPDIALLTAAVAPWVLILGLHQLLVFGSPLTTGYDYWLPELQEFAWSNAFSTGLQSDGLVVYPDRLNGSLMNWACSSCELPERELTVFLWPPLTYVAVLAGIFWILLPPFVVAFGFYWLWRTRHNPLSQLIGVVVVATFAMLSFYFYVGPRFMAPAASLLVVASSSGMVMVARSWKARFSSGGRGRFRPIA